MKPPAGCLSSPAGLAGLNEENVNKLCTDAGYILLAPVSLSKGHIKIGIICISTDGVTVGDRKYPTLYISFPSVCPSIRTRKFSMYILQLAVFFKCGLLFQAKRSSKGLLLGMKVVRFWSDFLKIMV